MYQPALRPRQIKALYYLKCRLGRPMTELVREAVEIYLESFSGPGRPGGSRSNEMTGTCSPAPAR